MSQGAAMSECGELISQAEASRRLGVHRRTVQRWIDQGALASVEVPSTLRLVRLTDVLALEGSVPRTSEQTAAGAAA